MRLLSIQIGSARELDIGPKTIQTGIFKLPVETARIESLGLVGDTINNKRHHGGPDQAVYCYSAQDYNWWTEQLAEAIPYGMFGENLTFSGFGPEEVRVGDRYQVGEVLLEVTAPRIPCATFAAKMDDKAWVKKFRNARRPGIYTRVLQTGPVKQGDAIEKVHSASENIGLVEFFDLWYQDKLTQEQLQRILAAPVDLRTRKWGNEQLKTQGSGKVEGKEGQKV
jgi:MOSC domain-containing protein YiiM